MAQTFFWYDFETFGVNPAKDWPCQFAGIRTDANFNEIGEPINIYCRLPNDQLPHPEACLVTGILPEEANEKGVCEAEFIDRINQEFSVPNTCVLGYNTLRFDDEVTRHSLYRNFQDPYAREWQNGCSRWDLIDVVRLCAALRPDGIHWPEREDGTRSFKLEELTKANGIAHEGAHDALSDVRATIAMARLLREKQPRLFDYVLNNRLKWQVAKQLDTVSSRPKPVIHISGKYPAVKHCLAMVAPLGAHPTNKNEVVVYDLSVDPQSLLESSAEDIRYRMFTSSKTLQEEGLERIPVKTIRLNRCPIIVPWKTAGAEDCERIGLDQQLWQKHYKQLFQSAEQVAQLRQKMAEVFLGGEQREGSDDPDLMLYSGGFFSNEDRDLIGRVKNTHPGELAGLNLPFSDGRLSEMLFRYRGRNWPDLLAGQDAQDWQSFRRERLVEGEGWNLQLFFERIEQLAQDADNPKNIEILNRLADYGRRLAEDL
ncbi:exodeoxyribonuclease I [Sansalvadorimonas verongulae]|uniref:exodeoxyribonuclease I n=1 Tax=Sansalvadorimonas verongulae TaxID=2172824 RepID=UPI002E37A46F|nr:exodeoxyribonuclease I [Sansalvadorimonas verongulae]MTI14260.1 exodeoxyribonuclease I [Sansalvadorimonas verongulae]